MTPILVIWMALAGKVITQEVTYGEIRNNQAVYCETEDGKRIECPTPTPQQMGLQEVVSE